MQIAQVLAGYTLGGADLLRRAMGKKKPEEMAKQRSVFVDGAVSRGVAPELARHIFDLMEKFAGYGFNKSHSAAYAVLSYQTAWLKAHHPAAFMAAVLSADMDRTDKVVTLIDECQRMGLEVEPPDVNASQYMFTVSGPRSIRYGLGAIKGVGEAAVEAMLGERTGNGPYRDIRDFCRRIDLNRVNRRVVEALIRSGAFDSLGVNRATLMHELPEAIQAADQTLKATQAGQSDLFGLGPEAATTHERDRTSAGIPEWSEALRLAGERETLGLYLTGHPITEYERELSSVISGRIADVGGSRPVGASDGGWRGPGRGVTLAGLVLEVRRRGGRTSFVLDDRSGRIEVALFDDVYQQYRALIARDAILVVDGALRWDDFIEDWRLQAKRILDVDQAREQYARHLVIRWPRETQHAGARFVAVLEQTLKPYCRGRCAVRVRYTGSSASAEVLFGEQWTVRPARELIERLGQIVGRDGVQVVYAPRVEA
jgi:DNA polymerase-3 subunit alpha